jgi:hypothetical protein
MHVVDHRDYPSYSNRARHDSPARHTKAIREMELDNLRPLEHNDPGNPSY